MMFPQFVHVTREGGKPDSEEKKFWFQADSAMLDVARRAIAIILALNLILSSQGQEPPHTLLLH